VDDVRELDRVADEGDREVVADEVPVAVFGVELDGEAAGVARARACTTRSGIRSLSKWLIFSRNW
jgi:hypothetical protein